MINIRSITLGLDWKNNTKHSLIKLSKDFIKRANVAFNQNKYNVRTTRIALPTLNSKMKITLAGVNSIVKTFSDICSEINVRWFCVPISFFKEENQLERNRAILEIAKRYKNAFINLIVADDNQINFEGVIDAAKLICDVSRLSNNGLDNFRLGVSCNCKPHTPFFPFAQHEGDNGFSIALETTELFLDALNTSANSITLSELQNVLVEKLAAELHSINEICNDLESKTSMKFNGIDASLAPFPDGKNSVARIIELLGVKEFGNYGTLFFTAFLTNIIKTAIVKSKIKAVGFNGVMYSLLEDDYMAANNNHRNFCIDSILAYSTMCGCGLDMIPIPGNVFKEEIATLILDTATLSVRLNKPLGVRVLPIPMKSANEFTEFNYDFLVDTRVVSVKSKFDTRKLTDSNFSFIN